jgi:galactokinase
MTTVVTSAPGRVNLIGEHTDYNDGFVLPTPLPLRTTVSIERRGGHEVTAVSKTVDAHATYLLGAEQRRGGWIDYVQGCTAALREAGFQLGGMHLVIDSAVPLGGGLSSSAALEVAVLRAIRTAFSLPIDDLHLALLGQKAENGIVGAPVGIMDQLVASVGSQGQALFLDVRAMTWRDIPLPDVDFVVVSSNIEHDHASNDYGKRRAECEAAARALGVATLRDVGPDELRRVGSLPAPLDRRARHVISENERVLSAVAAIERADLARLGELLVASHRSLRDDFEVSLPAIDALVDRALAQPEVLGARLTGGGFGGSILALARRGTGREVGARIVESPVVPGVPAPTVLIAESFT